MFLLSSDMLILLYMSALLTSMCCFCRRQYAVSSSSICFVVVNVVGRRQFLLSICFGRQFFFNRGLFFFSLVATQRFWGLFVVAVVRNADSAYPFCWRSRLSIVGFLLLSICLH